MHIESEANPVDEGTATPAMQEAAPDQQEAITPAVGESGDLEALTKEALGEPDATPEFIEVEIDGRKLKVMSADGTPVDPELKFGALRDADYRKKTMTLSEERKALQQEREAYQARANLEGEAAYKARELSALDVEIRQLSNIQIDDLRAQGWTDADISQAQAELQAKVNLRASLAQEVNTTLTRMQEHDRQSVQAAREQLFRELPLADKALTRERVEALEQFAISEGVDRGDIAMTTDPVAYRLLHYADIGKKFIERQRNAANIKAANAGTPATTLGGAASGGKSPDQMSAAEMAKMLGY